ncbi:3-oxoacyl-ACP reductase FabG [Desulfovibrio litoralis]|uniref:3-oxoacyl-[acyl-carrier protein] reductase n=1 Tax=Desulfovibrio litoralis DSM 11393 TaxID=1121455 RepID=A0A1M7SU75_9BACT|nr:3-oxoacyl-ACP reductase FabG [Desulfovibrio litoralis]SHN61936.1 3-oxoacyl-[acyl-carrier protein] reductase [Desulfovibrio litoralis DSM 11393]
MKTQKIALITGGSKGIGKAIALELAKEQYTVWLNYLTDHNGAKETQNIIEQNGGSCKLLPFDVSNLGECQQSLSHLLEEETPFALINNAGFSRDGILAMMSEEDWTKVINVHLNGFYNLTATVLPFMLRKRRGRIVNISSTSGETGVGGQVNYSAAKAGLIGATRSLAVEVAKRNILVNAVAPGFIDTEMTKNLPKEQILPSIPLGRFGTPEEVAQVVAFLCSEKNSYLTGQVLSVNGGIYT